MILMMEFLTSLRNDLVTKTIVAAKEKSSYDDHKRKNDLLQKQIDTLQTEIMGVQIKYQRELKKLEKKNRDLRHQ